MEKITSVNQQNELAAASGGIRGNSSSARDTNGKKEEFAETETQRRKRESDPVMRDKLK